MRCWCAEGRGIVAPFRNCNCFLHENVHRWLCSCVCDLALVTPTRKPALCHFRDEHVVQTIVAFDCITSPRSDVGWKAIRRNIVIRMGDNIKHRAVWTGPSRVACARSCMNNTEKICTDECIAYILNISSDLLQWGWKVGEIKNTVKFELGSSTLSAATRLYVTGYPHAVFWGIYCSTARNLPSVHSPFRLQL